MAQTTGAIHDAASRNAALLGVLSETDYAVPACEQQTQYIADLEREIQQTSLKLTKLTSTRQREGQDHERYQKSVMKKLAYRFSGKREDFETQAANEEREYFTALEEEHKGNRLKESLQDKLKEARDAKTTLELVVQRHAEAQKDLDDLYNRIFDGPSPEFPEEDAAEWTTGKSREAYREVQSKLDTENHVLNILRRAGQVMQTIQKDLGSASTAATWDVFGGGLTANMMERSSLGHAATGVEQLKSLLNEAARASPAITAIGDLNVASRSLTSTVFFDNIFTAVNYQNKIDDSKREMQNAARMLNVQVQRTIERINVLNTQVATASSQLDAARAELQRVRTNAFNRVVSQKS